ncbi:MULTISPECIES: adenine phosphoribosyltransferase [Georgenia]|jgi:adenine phosphoribosyltransferase|uniref:Adenine phosphoribosyltransferase n=1 Tax=Georgenia muralis TaxID=154117 RepID=A0A3N4ZSP7_9MICO|nr:adenine phosphoribosyltransferase [Georgenia muralis]RPF28502.1 adenine phosphoribosyltransferase [Georgenia muralis]
MTAAPQTAFPTSLTDLVRGHIREIPDFPAPGVLFRDITPLLADGPAFGALVDGLAEKYRGRVDAVAGLESRGFILAAPLANALGVGMITVRKAGRLPGPVIGVDYALEYGTARMELRPETVRDGQRVLIIDDVLATGGTGAAAVKLIERSGGEVVALAMLLELAALGGRSKLEGHDVDAVLVY